MQSQMKYDLSQLKSMLEAGLIDKNEYNERKQKISRQYLSENPSVNKTNSAFADMEATPTKQSAKQSQGEHQQAAEKNTKNTSATSRIFKSGWVVIAIVIWRMLADVWSCSD